jgi:hypothetical protein
MSKVITQMMENFWSEYGIHSSPFHMSGHIHKRFPNKKGDYIEECSAFIHAKFREMREKRQKYRSPDAPQNKSREHRDFIFECQEFQKVFEQNAKGLSWTLA